VYIGEIYKITNIINGKIYIGQTQIGIVKRWLKHIETSKYKNFKISKAIRKYGEDKFKIEVIDYAYTTNELNEKEKYWIEKYDSFKNGYNSTKGGEDNPMNYEENRKKVSEGVKGNTNWLGRKHTQEEKDKISKGNKGKIISEETIRKMVDARKNQIMPSGFNHPNSKSIVQINKYTNELIKIYGSIREAEININGKTTGNIFRVLSNNYSNKSAFGFKWMYKEDYDKLIS